MADRGIDYGLGMTNIDQETGIRYGVISMHDVLQAWCDSSEPQYGDPTCPKCGSVVKEFSRRDYICEDCLTKKCHQLDRSRVVELLTGVSIECREDESDEALADALRENVMDGTIDEDEVGIKALWSDDCFGGTPLCHTLNDGEYQASQGGDDSDIFVLKSPYYTRAQFCSPCAPGAGYLRNACDDGPKRYCFGPEWFDDSISPCPYPVYRVDNDECIYAPAADEANS